MVLPLPNGAIAIFTRGSAASALLKSIALLLPSFKNSITASSGFATVPYRPECVVIHDEKVKYENWTVIDGDHIELSGDRKKFLRERGHIMQSKSGGSVSQLIVQTLKKLIENRRVSYDHKQVLKGKLTAISDPRKDGRPATCY
ncbi:gamma-glutamyltranspeptidase 1 [Artemisia annua]|uniref:Gamma-glutamyltranspeptidase 1 n=1 Tax=Artemisia annua TaxID=35608 RepID=A0A2U1P3X7_ARTAN|nr:gamma-glutamyltranspeptidase 1 [Artemisia annua]